MSNYQEKYWSIIKENIYRIPFSSLYKKDIEQEIVSRERKKEIKSLLGMKETKIILSVGQFIHRKGFDILIDAARQIDGNVGIYIVGGEPTPEYLEQISSHGLNNIHFLNFMSPSELKKYYDSAKEEYFVKTDAHVLIHDLSEQGKVDFFQEYHDAWALLNSGLPIG